MPYRSYVYTFDTNGNVTSVTHYDNGIGGAIDRLEVFTFDASGNLISKFTDFDEIPLVKLLFKPATKSTLKLEK